MRNKANRRQRPQPRRKNVGLASIITRHSGYSERNPIPSRMPSGGDIAIYTEMIRSVGTAPSSTERHGGSGAFHGLAFKCTILLQRSFMVFKYALKSPYRFSQCRSTYHRFGRTSRAATSYLLKIHETPWKDKEITNSSCAEHTHSISGRPGHIA